ncbi:DUF4355 domain-containing protein [Paenibacillus macerans]|uniref:phage scaffolding protein n=1 Tax=Paenibacillus macerans TaxID=44252 RepID=UPI002DB60F56|nr:DUF4355 domain-containing protein [Paenibacillus macerans]MEC0328687.1 DUF4355 domain-containing protein [Paenibacillus macerans]
MKNEMTRFRYPLNLQLFGEEGGGADPNPDPNPNPPAPEPEKTFTQAEVDEIVAKRLARDRKGREDYDDIKAKLTALEQAEEERKKAEMTEAERLAAELEEARKQAQAAEEAKTSALAAANRRLISAEFTTLAREANIPADRIPAALKLADLAGVTVDEEGNVVGAKEAVDALVAAHGYLVEKPAPQPKPIGSPSGGSGGGNPDDDERKTLEAQLAEAKKARDFAKVIELSNKLLKK